MARLIGRYLALAVAVVLLNFLLPRLLPGDPLAAAAPDGISPATSTLTVQARVQLRAYYHLDQPLFGQLLSYLNDLAHGNLGWSISQAAPARDLVGERLPWTLGLLVTALIVSSVAGSLLGLLAAWRGGQLDQTVLTLSSGLAAMPEFLTAIALLLGFAVALRWFPLHGGQTVFASDPGRNPDWPHALVDVAWHLTLPALTLVLATSAAFVLVARGAVRSVLTETYLTTARAKGLSETQVASRHAAPNALLPVMTLFGLRLGQVLGGAIVVERVFAVPGLGLLAYQSIAARDYPVLQAVFLLGSLGVPTVNFGLELAYRRLERRVG